VLVVVAVVVVGVAAADPKNEAAVVIVFPCGTARVGIAVATEEDKEDLDMASRPNDVNELIRTRLASPTSILWRFSGGHSVL